MPRTTLTYFVLAGVVGNALLYPAAMLMFVGLAPALLLVPLGFMVAGGVVGGRLGLRPEVVRSLAWGFALIGVGVIGSSVGMHVGMAPRASHSASLLSCGALLTGFVAAGVAALTGAPGGRRTGGLLAFTVGGAIAASSLVIALAFFEDPGTLSVAASSVIGLGFAGALFRPEPSP